MKIIPNVEIIFRFPKERQYLVIGPFVVAHSGPGVEILRQPPLHGLAVDGRPASDHLALRHVDLPLFIGNRSPQGPVMLRVRGFCVACVAEFYLVGKIIRIGVIRPGFQQQNGGIRVFGQSAGQHRSSCSPTDNNNVIFHGPSVNGSSSNTGFPSFT